MFLIALLPAVVLLFFRFLREEFKWVDLESTLVVAAASFSSTIAINSLLDFSAPESHKLPIRDIKTISRRRYGPDSYIYVPYWKIPGQQIQISVRGDVYRDCKRKKYITITTKSGLLGKEWVRSFDGCE
jgi:hypothetical protein